MAAKLPQSSRVTFERGTLCDVANFKLPDYAAHVLGVLEEAGFETWVVGGWVRDMLLGNPSHDVDLTTRAHPQEIMDTLAAAHIEAHPTGIAHGTITAVVNQKPVEVTTFRSEGPYLDHRHPSHVNFVQTIEQDLARRDLTINAMAWHPVRGLLDPFGGAHDLQTRTIRAVGNPLRRFHEDALRVLRAVRFACRLHASIERETQAALELCARDLSLVARERIGQELCGIIKTGQVSWALMHQKQVIFNAIPELGALNQLDQKSPYHVYDVLEHTAHVCAAVEAFTCGCASDELRWAALLHDIAKPRTFTVDANGRGHFFGHPKLGAQMAQTIMERSALPKQLIVATTALIRLHDISIKATPTSARRLLAQLEKLAPGEAASLAEQLMNLMRSDAVSKVITAAPYAVDLDRMSARLRTELAAGGVYRVRDLAVSGGDLIAAGVLAPGPKVGEVLAALLEEVMSERLDNTPRALVARARTLMSAL